MHEQARQAVLVAVVRDDALHDPPDRLPPDPEQPGDRRERHLLRQPRHRVLEVAGVVRARPRPRHRLQPHPAVTAAQQPQLALDPAARRAEIEVPPAFDAAIVDLEPAGLPARRAHAPAAPEPDRHDDALGGEADVDHGCPRQAEQPLECRGDAHVALLHGPLISTTSSLLRGRRRVARVLRNLRGLPIAAKPLLRRSTPRPPHPQVERRPCSQRCIESADGAAPCPLGRGKPAAPPAARDALLGGSQR